LKFKEDVTFLYNLTAGISNIDFKNKSFWTICISSLL